MQSKTISVRSKLRCGARAFLTRTSIKSAGVAELIGELVQGRSASRDAERESRKTGRERRLLI